MAKTRKRQDNTGSSAVEDRIDPTQPRHASAAAERQPSNDIDPGRGDRIAARAYELYLARGGGHGSDWDDWLEAERQVASADDDRTGD